MKRILTNVLAIATIAATALFASCAKQNSTVPEPQGNVLAGDYTLTETPLYAVTEAADPDAVALSFGENMDLKYSDINTLFLGITTQTKIGVTGTITLAENGTIAMLLTDTEDGSTIEFPNEAEGIAADAITYAVNNNTITFTLSTATVDEMLGTETDPENAAAIKMMLANFSSPIFAYNTEANTLAVKLNYTLTEGQLSVFVDRDMLLTTVNNIDENTLNGIIAMLPQDNETTATIAQLLPFLMPQMSGLLEGYNTLEVGLHVTEVAE